MAPSPSSCNTCMFFFSLSWSRYRNVAVVQQHPWLLLCVARQDDYPWPRWWRGTFNHRCKCFLLTGQALFLFSLSLSSDIRDRGRVRFFSSRKKRKRLFFRSSFFRTIFVSNNADILILINSLAGNLYLFLQKRKRHFQAASCSCLWFFE